jgi:H/ACA ribonucleoprotein complex subunit 4
MGAADEGDYSIKPEAVASQIPTSEWPLLLKNYDKRAFTLPRTTLVLY